MPSCDRGRQNWNDSKLKSASKEICEFYFSDNFHRVLQDRTQYKSLALCQAYTEDLAPNNRETSSLFRVL